MLAGNVMDLPAGISSSGTYARPSYRKVTDGSGFSRSRRELMHVALEQSSLRDAAAVILIAAVYERTTAKYSTRGIRYLHMEVGHAAQNVYLQAVALDLRTVAIVRRGSEKSCASE
jgi:SagB-type dehydrogenase family enzyme